MHLQDTGYGDAPTQSREEGASGATSYMRLGRCIGIFSVVLNMPLLNRSTEQDNHLRVYRADLDISNILNRFIQVLR